MCLYALWLGTAMKAVSVCPYLEGVHIPPPPVSTLLDASVSAERFLAVLIKYSRAVPLPKGTTPLSPSKISRTDKPQQEGGVWESGLCSLKHQAKVL